MRRWMSIITLAALVFALVAGWGIGQLAGGGDGGEVVIVRPPATLVPTTSVASEPTSLPISMPAATFAATPRTAGATPADPEPAPATPLVTASPDAP